MMSVPVPAPVPEYLIEYYQVNIGTGDCEIVLVLEDATPKPKVYKAVLIDGGSRISDQSLNNIRATFEDIQDKHYANGEDIKFDAVIISHWDEDHYGRLLKLMKDDLIDVTVASKTVKQVKWLKYDATSEPESCLYCPYPSDAVAKSSNLLFNLPTLPERIGTFDLDGAPKVCKLVCDTPSIAIPMGSNPTPFSTGLGDHNLLGQELLEYIFNPTTQSATSPNDLVTKSQITRPGLFCVAVNYIFLPPLSSSSPYFHDNDVTETNKCSIVCVVVWPDFRITHYMGGDAPLSLEQGVMDWTGFEEDDANTIPIVKASHHGSVHSWPVTLGPVFKPSFILLSANNSYFHPSWEVIFLIYSWTEISQTLVPPPKVFMTRYPYYLEDSGVDLNAKEDWAKKNLVELELNLQASYGEDVPRNMEFSEWVLFELRATVIDGFRRQNDQFPGPGRATAAARAKTEIVYIIISSDAGGKTFTGAAFVPYPAVPKAAISRKRTMAPTPTTVAPKRIKKNTLRRLTGGFRSNTSSNTSGGTIYYILSSVVELSPPSTSSHGAAVVGMWNRFISNLLQGYIGVSTAVTTTCTSVEVDSSDEWVQWLETSLSPTSEGENASISLTIKTELDGSHVKFDSNAFALSMTLSPLASTTHYSFTAQSNTIVGPPPYTTFNPSVHFLRFTLSYGSSINLIDLLSLTGLTKDIVWFESTNLDFQLDKDTSAFWFSPLFGNYSAQLRLQGKSVDANVIKFVSSSFNTLGLWKDGTIPSSLIVVAKKSMAKYARVDKEAMEQTDSELGFELAFSNFTAGMFCSDKSYLFVLRWEGNTALEEIENLLKKIGHVQDFTSTLQKIAHTFKIQQASFEVKKPWTISKISVDAELVLNYNGQDTGPVFLLTYTWPQKQFCASLYAKDSTVDSWRASMPDYEPLLHTTPSLTPSQHLSILTLFPDGNVITVPHGIPTEITQADLRLDTHSISFSCILKPPTPSSESAAIPKISFVDLELHASYGWASKDISLNVAGTVNLHPDKSSEAPTNTHGPGFLSAYLGYDSKSGWKLTGILEAIKFSDLVAFFDESENEQVRSVLGNLNIETISLSYNYDTEGKASDFLFDGYLMIGKIRLFLEYSRKGKKKWQVKAALANSTPCTLFDIITDICGNEIKSEVPDFFNQIKFKFNSSAKPTNDKEWEDSPVYLTCTPTDEPGSLSFLFQATVPIKNSLHMSFRFIQAGKKVGEKGIQRLLVFSLTNILSSLTLEVPIFDPLKDSFNGFGLEFVWMHDSDSASHGLTRAQVGAINKKLFPNGDGVQFKDDMASPSDSDVIIAVGSHFMMLVGDINSGAPKVALDYKFSANVSNTLDNPDTNVNNTPDSPDTNVNNTRESPEVNDPSDTPESPKAAAPKKIGPLSISNVGLHYTNGSLFIMFDAALSLGPISLALLGFGLGIGINSDLFANPQITPKLSGLAAELNSPPLLLEGAFEKLTYQGNAMYSGGVEIKLTPYGLLAFGSYEKSENSNAFFVFGELNGPFVELEFAYINGVSLGFGYNYHLTYPTINNVLNFPLIKGISQKSSDSVGSSSNVLLALLDSVFDNWLRPQAGSMWFAAGFKVLAFEALSVQTVAVIEVDPAVSLGLFADAICSFPPPKSSGPSDFCFLYAELAITSQLNLRDGLFLAEAKLSPKSFILHPSCHLLGGFASGYWFDPSPYAGDFVFTVGGYHPAFKCPTYYPKPQRLSISWQYDKNIGITGESYFAITPKECMGGGSLSIMFSCGPIQAHLNAYADFFMFWRPFYFVGDIGVDIGVGYEGKILFCSVHIMVDVGASLHIQGPPFSGHVHVNFYVSGFDIYFGGSPSRPPAMKLQDFWDSLISKGGKGITFAVDSGNDPSQGHKSQDHKVEIKTSSTSTTPWVFTRQFKILIQCQFPLSKVQYNGAGSHISPKAEVYCKPMYCTTPVQSTLDVIVTNKQNQKVGRFTFQPIYKNLPSARWGQYNSMDDPTVSSSSSSQLDGDKNSTIAGMLVGVAVTSPSHAISKQNVPSYNAYLGMGEPVIEGGKKFPTEEVSDSASFWLPSATSSWSSATSAWSPGATSVAEVWRKALKWNANLNGKAPTLLLKESIFNEVYSHAPSVTRYF